MKNITYKNCREVANQEIYQGFMDGFQDYLVPFKYSQRDFIYRFFVLDGNKKEYSFMTYYKKQPVGIIIGGISEFHRKKTLRCGGLAVVPEYRGLGIGEGLVRLHKELGKREHCDQLLLEVLVENKPAIAFYEKQGYTTLYKLFYYSISASTMISGEQRDTAIRPTTLESIQKFHTELSQVHFTWKQHPRMLLENPQIHYYLLEEQDVSKGMVGITPGGEILLLVTGEDYRHQGVATRLVDHMIKINTSGELTIGFASNPDLEGFLQAYGFRKRVLEQYEMYLPLNGEEDR